MSEVRCGCGVSFRQAHRLCPRCYSEPAGAEVARLDVDCFPKWTELTVPAARLLLSLAMVLNLAAALIVLPFTIYELVSAVKQSLPVWYSVLYALLGISCFMVLAAIYLTIRKVRRQRGF